MHNSAICLVETWHAASLRASPQRVPLVSTVPFVPRRINSGLLRFARNDGTCKNGVGEQITWAGKFPDVGGEQITWVGKFAAAVGEQITWAGKFAADVGEQITWAGKFADAVGEQITLAGKFADVVGEQITWA